jgi:uncharacterized protein (TIGR03086 family)
MSEYTWKILEDAHQALRTVVSGVSADGWARPTPCEKWNVTQVLQHAAGDQLGYSSTLTGGPRPTEDPFSPSGHLDGDPATYVEAALRSSAAAFAAVAPDAQNVPTPLPQGALAAPVAVGACALDAAVHAWDIAMSTGQPSPLTPEMARTLMPVATALVEPLRQWGAYAAIVPAADGDGDVEALLRYLGRRPDWSA